MEDLENSALGPHMCRMLEMLDDSLNETVNRLAVTQRSVSYFTLTVTAIEHVRYYINMALNTYAMKQNERALAATAHLPPELLSEIFTYLTFADCISVSHVSRRWRDVAVDTTSLWSTIKSFDQPPDVLKARLTRVPTGVPIRLAAHYQHEENEELVTSLLSRMSDFRVLHIRFMGAFVDCDISPLVRGLSCPAPNLHHLSLVCNNASSVLQTGHLQLLANHAPALRSLIFYGAADIIRDWQPGAHIRRLLFSEPGATTERSLRIVSQSFPSVEELAIEIDDWKIGSNVDSEDVRVVLPASVRRFVLGVSYGLDLSHLLRKIAYNSLPIFIVYATGKGVTPLDMPFVLSNFLGNGGDPQSVKDLSAVSNASSRNRIIRTVSVRSRLNGNRHRWLVNVQIFALVSVIRSSINLTSLTIDETLLTPGRMHESHMLPNLKRVVIVLLAQDDLCWFGEDSIFLMGPGASPLLICPVLDTFVLATTDTIPRALAPDLVRDVLSNYISCQYCPNLGLYRAYLLESLINAVISLLEQVRDIRLFEDSELELSGSEFISSVVRSLSWQPPF